MHPSIGLLLLLILAGPAAGQVNQSQLETADEKFKEWVKEMTKDTVILQCRGTLSDRTEGYPDNKATETPKIFDVEFNEVKAPDVLKVGLTTHHFSKYRPIKCSFTQQKISCESDKRFTNKAVERSEWARSLRPFDTEVRTQYTLEISRNTGTLMYSGSVRETQTEGPTRMWTLSEQGTFECQRAPGQKF
jgi:hypothetical protein